MRSFLHNSIAAVTLLAGAIAPQACSARETVEGITAGASSVVADRNLADSPAVPVFACGAASSSWTGNASVPSGAIPLALTMADFTGDSNPDLATIELDRFDSSNAHYFIEIQLTEGGHQSFQLTGPARSLVITSKDVTGDGTPDLIVRAVGSQAPVAVFLNDGCGHFSAKDSAPFAGALHDFPGGPEFAGKQLCFGSAVAATVSYGAKCQSSSRRPSQERRGSLLLASQQVLSQLFSPFGSNRAPPTLA